MNLATLCAGCMQNDSGAPVCPDCGAPFDLGAQNSLQLAPRTLLHDQYLIGRALGQGGFGVTYLAWDTDLQSRQAVKEYLPNGVAGRGGDEKTVVPYSEAAKQEYEYGLERFLDEARTLKKFNHYPGIVSVNTVFRENGTAYLVMEYLDGSTLEEFLHQHSGKIPFESALPLILPVMDAMGAVHAEGILHRDISPDNIYLTRSGKVKLIDFGAARNALVRKSKNLSVILKDGYAPEEQYRASGPQGPWTDVYATAATLYHAISGRKPQSSLDRQVEDKVTRPSASGVSIDPVAEAALMKALAVKAADRFQSMQDFKAALTGAVDVRSAPEAAPLLDQIPPAAAESLPKTKPKWLWPVAGAVAVILVMVAFFRPNPQPDHPGALDPRASSNYESLLQQAAQLDKSRSYSDEIKVLNQAISLDSNRWEAYDQQGQAYLYGLNQLAPAEQAFQSSLARGGSATLHVMHDHGSGNFASHCSGLLSVSKSGAEYKATDSAHHFKMTHAEIQSARHYRPVGARVKTSDRSALEIRIGRGEDLIFAPLGQFADAQRELALKILSAK